MARSPRRQRGLVILLLVALGFACADGPTDPGPQTASLALVLMSPHADDGALLLEVTGPGFAGVPTVAGAYLLHARADESSFRAALFGAIEDGALLTFDVPDGNRAGEYAARLVQVADSASALRPSLDGYTLRITPE